MSCRPVSISIDELNPAARNCMRMMRARGPIWSLCDTEMSSRTEVIVQYDLLDLMYENGLLVVDESVLAMERNAAVYTGPRNEIVC